MPYYILESPEKTIECGGITLHGIPTTGHSRNLWLYIVRTDQNPLDWPESSSGRGAGHRRAPHGMDNWWVVVERGAKARSSDGLRSTGTPLVAPPQGYPVFDWAFDLEKGADILEKSHVSPSGGAGFGDAEDNKLIESTAVREVEETYRREGWSVRSVEHDKRGFDLECTKNSSVEYVEVKGVRGPDPCFIITAGEVNQARENPNFFLAVVTSTLSDSPKITKYTGEEFSQKFNLTALQYRAVPRR